MWRWTSSLVMTVAVACAAPAGASDPWEGESADDGPGSTNILRHGVVQQLHDLDGVAPPDQDWTRAVTKARHSYEARVSGLYWEGGCAPPPCPASFARVSQLGTVLTPGVASSEDPVVGAGSTGRTVRWIADTGGAEYLRVTGHGGTQPDEAAYDIVLLDTTLFVPRWNNSATQVTVLLLQNTTDAPVTGSVYFHDGAGTLRATAAVSVPVHGVQVLSTASLPALAGLAGSAQVAHLGGYGALAGKAVALEPGTGFTFDTAIVPLAR